MLENMFNLNDVFILVIAKINFIIINNFFILIYICRADLKRKYKFWGLNAINTKMENQIEPTI